MSNRGIPEAESSDQSWMNPQAPPKVPVAPYSEFNPPPERPPAVDHKALPRAVWRAVLLIAIGVALLTYVIVT